MGVVAFIGRALSFLTVAGQAWLVGILALFIFARTSEPVRFLSRHALLLSFLIALTATLGSLFYSEVMGYEPCKLCWVQRIFIYPQVILLGMALVKKQRWILDYALALSVPGLFVAGYHYLLQRGLESSLPCSVVGYSASCSQRFVMEFGYITIPLMAFTAFALIIFLILLSKVAKH
ncbi:MAG: disulfide bond formation protein B [bacterium]|nr:disulfide bond formation protein B [bacterium]